ncbi:hypothetical protein [Spiroplasma endosymbiont of Megaselia nigra]|uniref:hypothetical protein n=1 Tax=Spiroplasma endosymbiont of Megaselia nigra TaxID=2478537 RepID=UPI000F87F94B|nr:hypothetical protein [Spiroplasma endosymbiont of Megaselia nigra]RUO86433.1 hypothetical protein D9R21_03145 [Spiroplasma endosymbiont of Megaselia nigra]
MMGIILNFLINSVVGTIFLVIFCGSCIIGVICGLVLGIKFHFKPPVDSKEELQNKRDDEEQKGGAVDECNTAVSRKNY